MQRIAALKDAKDDVENARKPKEAMTMAGIKDVAREAGVSVSTVSYALSGKRSISAKTSDKVMAAVEKLGYTPDASARKMRGIRSQVIALSAPIRGDINQAKYNAYFLHTAWAARNAGYDVLLLTGPDAVNDIRRVTQSNLVDGVVLLDVEQDDERAAASGDFSKPCIAIGYPQAHEGCACVDIDFAEAGRKAVDFLFDKGHRKVAFLRNNEADYERRSGYVVIFRESMLSRAKERGMTVVESSRYEDDRFDAIRFVRETFADEDRPTAIINQANANVLNRVLQELSVAGLSVPEDVSVLSCGTYFDGELMSRPITEMPVMPEKLCLQAMGLLVSAIEQGVKIKGDVELEAPAVKLRGSVAEISPGKRALKVASR